MRAFLALLIATSILTAQETLSEAPASIVGSWQVTHVGQIPSSRPIDWVDFTSSSTAVGRVILFTPHTVTMGGEEYTYKEILQFKAQTVFFLSSGECIAFGSLDISGRPTALSFLPLGNNTQTISFLLKRF